MQGFQQRYLEDMAVFAMRNSNTFITEDKARRSISDTGDLLVSEGQITNKPEPNPVLDALVSNHVLMRMGESGYSFQHQQLQEWYVSHWIESRIIGEVSDSKRCEGLAEIFNFPLWEEAILFAIERLAHGDSDRQIVCGKAILVAFDVDPILAAEMIFRSTNEVWGRIDKTIQESITRWHAPGKVDRALRFMVTSGRSEFINAVWPLITNKDEQISLNALRNCGQFKPSILGDDAGKKIKLLPPDARLVLLKEMVWCSGIDGIDIATEVAKADPVSEIKKSVIEDLIFQRANRHVAEVLEESDDEIFDMVVRENLVSELGNRQVRENLAKARERQSRAKKSDIDQLRMIVFAQDNEDYSTELTQIISTMKIKQRGEEQWGGEIGLISEAHNRYPHAVANGLLERVRAGRTLFYNAANMLASAEFNIDGNEIVQLALDNPTRHDERAESAASVLGKKSATRFLEEFLNVETRLLTSGEHDKMTGEIYRGLQSRIEYVSGPSLVAAVLTRSALADNQEIERLANILSRPRHIETGQERPYDSESTKTIQELVKDWGERLLVSNDSTRRQKLSVANLARRVPSVSLLPILKRLLDDNLQRYRTFLSVLRQQSKPNYQSQRSAYHEYQSIVQEVQRPMTCKYYPIFLAINAPETSDMMRAYLTDEHFGEFAAKVIAKQWQIANESPSEKRSFSLIGIDFSGVKEKRLDRADNPNKTSPGAEAIFAVIDSLIAKGATDEQKNLAVKLGIAASRLPHGQRDDTIQQLIALSPTRQDRERLLLHLALSGKDIDAEIVANSIAEIIEKTPNKNDELQAWMSLLPFVDYPTKILNVIRKMPPEQRDPRLFRDMIKAFGDSTSERAEDAFFNLAKEDPRFYSIYEWQTTAFQFGTSNSAHYILDLTAQGVFEGGSMADSHLIKELGNIIASSPDIRMYAYELLKKRPILHGHVKIAQAVAWNPDEDGVFLLIKFEEESRCSSLATQAVEKITTKHVPSEIPKNNAFRVVPIPANRLREKLLALTTDGSLSDTAARLLRHIDRIRDEVGIPESETRHPDLGSGKPWPILIPDPVATATNSIHLTKNL
ncbi:MAG: hypothetical protein OXF42_06100 [Candidatus Dadabacteria bacterium]|nr:hypothetical protein [Candidatus Dadabacteria bacterium]